MLIYNFEEHLPEEGQEVIVLDKYNQVFQCMYINEKFSPIYITGLRSKIEAKKWIYLEEFIKFMGK